MYALVIAGTLLFLADAPSAFTSNPAWAMPSRFASTELALPSFLHIVNRETPANALLLGDLGNLSSMTSEANSSRWGGRDPEQDFFRSAEFDAASATGSPSPSEVRNAVGSTLTHGDLRITSGFGFRQLGGITRHHDGIDIAMPYGSPIRARWAGRVKFTGWQGGYGQLVVIEHGGGKESYYAHASVLRAREGDNVAAGDVIAYVGTTGRSYGPHLHFEIRYNDVPIDPEEEYASTL